MQYIHINVKVHFTQEQTMKAKWGGGKMYSSNVFFFFNLGAR